jgi:hypothetical protein
MLDQIYKLLDRYCIFIYWKFVGHMGLKHVFLNLSVVLKLCF